MDINLIIAIKRGVKLKSKYTKLIPLISTTIIIGILLRIDNKNTQTVFDDQISNTIITSTSSQSSEDDSLSNTNSFYSVNDTLELDSTIMQPFKETEHFIFECTEKDIVLLNLLAYELESNYFKFTSDFNITPSSKTTINIYPDLESFHESIGIPNVNGKIISAFNFDNEIQIVSPNNCGSYHTYDSVIASLPFEFIQILMYEINPNIPRWVNEGLASYVTGGNTDIRSIIEQSIINNKIPTFRELNNYQFFYENNGYAYANTFIEFICQEYGLDIINEWLRSPYDYEKIFGINEDDLYEDWTEFLYKNYVE